MEKTRCKWCNLDNELYVKYHDEEWGVPNFDNDYLFEMLILESFQAGLSWETILNKREDFRTAFDDFDVDKVAKYDDEKIEELMNNEKIIRHKLKITSAINNAQIFKEILNIGPTITGGRSLLIQWFPVTLIINAIATYTRPTTIKAEKMLDLPPIAKPAIIGAMNANELPRYTGLLFRVQIT